jgi:iron-sulfur cluster assembly accessory protein
MSVQEATTAATTVKIGKKSDTIVLTDAATAKVAALIAAEGDATLALRVAVRPGGCSGFSYEMFFDGDIADDDIVKTYGADQVKVVTDYKDALQGGGFAVDNPNATRSCGCGNSFS